MLKFTSKVDRNGRPFAIRTTEKNVTKFSGLPFLMDRVRQAGVLSDVARILDSYVPRGLRCLYSTTDLIEQIMAGIFVKAPDLNDMKWLSNDHAFRIALSNPCCASPATMCRFFRSFSKDCQSERNEYLTENGLDLSSLAKTDPHRISTEVFLKLRDFTIGRAIDTVTKYYPEGPILVDVDSTPIEVFGSNGEIAYDGCYDCKGYLPILCLINGVPAFVQNAPGAANGAKLFSFHVQELLQRLKEAFPKRLIVIRADTGFSAPAIIDAVEKEDCKYLIGCNQAQKQMCAALYEHMVDRLVIAPDTPLTVPKAIAEALRLDNLFIKFKEPQPRDQFNTSCVDGKFRCTGFVPNYKAKSWATHRTIVYRFEYDPKRKEIDVRFIQTNLTKEEAIDISKGRGAEKDRSRANESFELNKIDAEASMELYESLFCDRAQAERVNREWKSDCSAKHCSFDDFFANSLHQVFTLLCFQVFESYRLECISEESLIPDNRKKRNGQKINISRSHNAAPRKCGPTIDSIRHYLINVAGIVKDQARRITYSIPPLSSTWERRFDILLR